MIKTRKIHIFWDLFIFFLWLHVRQKGKRDLRRGVSLIGVGILPFIPSLQAGLVVLGAVGFVWGTWTLLSGIFTLTNQNYRNSNSTPNQ